MKNIFNWDLVEYKTYIYWSTLLIYLWGIIDSSIYYGLWGINFVNYISFPELLLDSIINISIILIITVVYIVVVLKPLQWGIQKIKFGSDVLNKVIPSILELIIAIILTGLYLLFQLKAEYYNFFIIAVYLPFYFRIFKEYSESEQAQRELKSLIIIYTFFVVFNLVISPITRHLIAIGDRSEQFEYKMSDNTIYSSDSLSFIGETTNNVFLFDLNSFRTVILSRSNVIESQLDHPLSIKIVEHLYSDIEIPPDSVEVKPQYKK